MDRNQLTFNISVGRQKPESILNKEAKCPFCDRENLENIYDIDGEIIWLKNKYPVLDKAFQTVIIETAQCHSDISQYTTNHLIKLFTFAIEKWLDMEKNERFKSVILLENYGYLSGGSLRHPHMQIIGFEEIDYLVDVQLQSFEGIPIDCNDNVEWNLSTHPRMGFYEWNIILHNPQSLETMALYVQKTIDYLLHQFSFPCESYNLLFYHIDEKIIAKVIPRFVTSPLFIGYSIRQVANNVDEIVSDMKSRFLINQ